MTQLEVVGAPRFIGCVRDVLEVGVAAMAAGFGVDGQWCEMQPWQQGFGASRWRLDMQS